jgi:glycerol-3-phosphate acyltransferase PlsY
MMIAKFAAVLVMGYLIGSIPIGYLLARRRANVDVTAYGSGKTGTTNVLRTAGRKSAALVGTLDLFKGVVAVVLAGLIVGRGYLVIGDFGFGTLVAQVLAALAAVVGHNWSVFLRFKGGRGVATFFGGLVALCPIAAIVGGEIIVIGAGLTQYVSLGSIAGVVGAYAILVPLTILNGFPLEYLLYALVGAVIIIVMHRDNIMRLVRGKERRLGEQGEKRGSHPSDPTEGVG